MGPKFEESDPQVSRQLLDMGAFVWMKLLEHFVTRYGIELGLKVDGNIFDTAAVSDSKLDQWMHSLER